jgi:hypothetical protein
MLITAGCMPVLDHVIQAAIAWPHTPYDAVQHSRELGPGHAHAQYKVPARLHADVQAGTRITRHPISHASSITLQLTVASRASGIHLHSGWAPCITKLLAFVGRKHFCTCSIQPPPPILALRFQAMIASWAHSSAWLAATGLPYTLNAGFCGHKQNMNMQAGQAAKWQQCSSRCLHQEPWHGSDTGRGIQGVWQWMKTGMSMHPRMQGFQADAACTTWQHQHQPGHNAQRSLEKHFSQMQSAYTRHINHHCIPAVLLNSCPAMTRGIRPCIP